tara:strand:+ start:674 stop:1357 length:684 start_codon:yes stop_codon:yes gene_type:complete
MLALKLGLSLNSSNYPSSSAWSPTSEASLEAWYQKDVGVTEDGGDITAWADSSSNSNNITTTEGKRPAYSGGRLTFTGANDDFLSISSDINLTGEFTIAYRANPTGLGALLGNTGTSSTEIDFLKYQNTIKITLKIDNASNNFELDSGVWANDNIVVTRNSSNLIAVHVNGTQLTDTSTRAGTVKINVIGNRTNGLNDFTGTAEEFQFYSSTSEALTTNVIARLASL